MTGLNLSYLFDSVTSSVFARLVTVGERKSVQVQFALE